MTKPELETLRKINIYDKPTLIKTDKGNRYSDIPEKDFDLLMDFYDFLPHPKLQNKNWDFVLKLDSRVYAEWCMSNPSKNHLFYQGEGFLSFVRDETHFELVRKSYQWNNENFENLDQDRYDKARKRILGGLTLRGIELFSDWNDFSPPSRMVEIDGRKTIVYDDKRNIRTDLNDYIIAFDSMNFKI